jgi:hypothetical protein
MKVPPVGMPGRRESSFKETFGGFWPIQRRTRVRAWINSGEVASGPAGVCEGRAGERMAWYGRKRFYLHIWAIRSLSD